MKQDALAGTVTDGLCERVGRAGSRGRGKERRAAAADSTGELTRHRSGFIAHLYHFTELPLLEPRVFNL